MAKNVVVKTAAGTYYEYDSYTNTVNITGNPQGSCSEVKGVSFCEVSEVSSLPNIDTFIIELTQNCNMRCRYCCYGGSYQDNRTHSGKSMSEGTYLLALDFIEKNRVKERKLNIVFYGGEPLTGFERLKKMLSLAKSRFHEDTDYTISTNGLLLSEEVIRWSIDNGVYLNVSLDGKPSVHDKSRRDAAGRATFDRVHQNLSQIKSLDSEYWYTHVNLLVTLDDVHKLLPIAKYWGKDVLLRTKSPYMISRVSPCTISDYELNSGETIKALRALMNFYAVNRQNVFAKAYFEMLCSPILDRPVYTMSEPMSPLMCLPFNPRCFVDCDGNVGICEKTSDKLRIGTLRDGWDFNAINKAIGKMANERISRCGDCECIRLCQTCFTNYFYDEERWSADCEWQRAWLRISLTITLELLERNLIDSDESKEYFLDDLKEDDIPSILEILGKEEVVKNIDGLAPLKNFEDSKCFYLLISGKTSNFAQSGKMLAIRERKARMVGAVGLDEITNGSANLFFFLDSKCWHRGVMTAMLSNYLGRYLPDEVQRIETHINPANSHALLLTRKFSSITVTTESLNLDSD